MVHRTARRCTAALSASIACFALTAVRPSDGADASVAQLSVSQAVSRALRGADGGPTAATYDESTACMGASPQALAYTTNRIVLRTGGSAPAVTALLQSALGAIGLPGVTVGTPHEITLPRKNRHDPGVTPVWWSDLDPHSDTPVPVVRLARELVLHHGTPGAPDYLYSPTSGPVGMWPNGFPTPAPSLPDPRPGNPGDKTNIAIYDTGVPAANSNPPPNVDQFSVDDTEELDRVSPIGQVDLYYGDHLTAMAGVINEVAPGATVTALRMTQPNGVATDVSAATRMATTLKGANRNDAWPSIIVNAFGSPACALDPNNPVTDLVPLGLQAVDEAVDRIGQALVVASSGNRSTTQRFYPAAFDSVVAVGALDNDAGDADADPLTSASRTGPRADFSNYGDWVDFWTPGVELVTNHVDGLKFESGGQTLHGVAYVSGTSFAAPYFAALLAERMVSGSEDALAARDDLKSAGVRCNRVSGGGRAVTLVDLAGTALDPPTVARAATDC